MKLNFLYSVSTEQSLLYSPVRPSVLRLVVFFFKKIYSFFQAYFFFSFNIVYFFYFYFIVAWFTFDPVLSGGPGSGLIFSNNNSTVSVEGWEHRVALGSVGFSRGIHYWEFTIDNYTADTDPAFGVARIDVNRNKMLGKYSRL